MRAAQARWTAGTWPTWRTWRTWRATGGRLGAISVERTSNGDQAKRGDHRAAAAWQERTRAVGHRSAARGARRIASAVRHHRSNSPADAKPSRPRRLRRAAPDGCHSSSRTRAADPAAGIASDATSRIAAGNNAAAPTTTAPVERREERRDRVGPGGLRAVRRQQPNIVRPTPPQRTAAASPPQQQRQVQPPPPPAPPQQQQRQVHSRHQGRQPQQQRQPAATSTTASNSGRCSHRPQPPAGAPRRRVHLGLRRRSRRRKPGEEPEKKVADDANSAVGRKTKRAASLAARCTIVQSARVQWFSTFLNCHGSRLSMSSGNRPGRPVSGVQSV